MTKISKKYLAAVSAVSVLTILFFQNCSRIAFQEGFNTAGALPSAAEARKFPDTGTYPNFSDTCDNYLESGWDSKISCLSDGNWHEVYDTQPGSSIPVYSSTDELYQHVLAGADIKVVVPTQNLFLNGAPLALTMTANEECQQVYRSQNGAQPIYCLTTTRFSGEQSFEATSGSTRYGSDGSIYCNGLRSPGRNGCTVDPLGYKWYVRY